MQKHSQLVKFGLAFTIFVLLIFSIFKFFQCDCGEYSLQLLSSARTESMQMDNVADSKNPHKREYEWIRLSYDQARVDCGMQNELSLISIQTRLYANNEISKEDVRTALFNFIHEKYGSEYMLFEPSVVFWSSIYSEHGMHGSRETMISFLNSSGHDRFTSCMSSYERNNFVTSRNWVLVDLKNRALAREDFPV